jgi:hypothetical protein
VPVPHVCLVEDAVIFCYGWILFNGVHDERVRILIVLLGNVVSDVVEICAGTLVLTRVLLKRSTIHLSHFGLESV